MVKAGFLKLCSKITCWDVSVGKSLDLQSRSIYPGALPHTPQERDQPLDLPCKAGLDPDRVPPAHGSQGRVRCSGSVGRLTSVGEAQKGLRHSLQFLIPNSPTR